MQHTPSQDSHLDDDILSERLDDRLASADQQRVEQHLATCATCAARLADLRVTRAALRSLRTVTLPRDFRLDLAATTPAAPPRLMATRTRTVSRFLSAAALLCGLLFLAFGIFTITATSNSTEQTATSNTAHQVVTSTSTSCAAKVNCPSVNVGAATDPNPTFTPATDVQANAPVTNSTTGGSFGAATPPTTSHNTTPATLALILGGLATVAGAIGLFLGRRATKATP